MRKFGIELEVSGITKEQAAEALNAAGIETVAENYNHRTRNYWKATTDSSIRSDNGHACELVSPPLPYKESSFAVISKVVAALKEIGAVVNDSCGMHVHVDCRGITDPDFYRLLLTFYSKFENEIDMFVDTTRRDNSNTYCRTNKSLYESWDRLWSNYAEAGSASLTDIFSNVERYHKLNFASFVRHGTVEFRQYQGTLNINDIRAWVDFCVGLVENTTILCAQNKSKLRSKKAVKKEKQVPQFLDYVQAAKGILNRSLSGIAQPIPQFETPYEALSLINHTMPAVDMAQYVSDINLIRFSNEEVNNIFKFLVQYVLHICTKAVEFSDHARENPNNDNAIFRDQSIKIDEDFPFLITSLFFGFSGTREEVIRKSKAKLTNIGLYRNGRFRFDNNFYSFFEFLVDRNAPSSRSLSQNSYHLSIYQPNRYAPEKVTRANDIQHLTNEFNDWTKRYWVSNPRNLRIVSSGQFSQRRSNMISEAVAYILNIRHTISGMSIDNIGHHYTELTFSQRNERNNNVRRAQNNFYSFRENMNGVKLFSELNPDENYEAVSKQPYFEFVDDIRKNEFISKAFVDLADTSKIVPIRGGDASHFQRDIEESIRRVKAFIEERNNPCQRANNRQERVYTSIPEDVHEMIRSVGQIGLSSASRDIIIGALTGNVVEMSAVTEAVRELESVSIVRHDEIIQRMNGTTL